MSKLTNLLDVAKYFEDRQVCIDYLTQMRWGGKVRCAFCDHEKVYELKGNFKRFKCAKCRKQFSALKGSIFENSPIPLQKWFMAVYLLSGHKKGISSLQLADEIKVTQKTAWFMGQRIRFALKVKSFEGQKEGIFQVDETYVGGKNKNRHAHKKVPKSQGRSIKDKVPVLGIVQTGGKVHVVVVKDTKSSTIQPIINGIVAAGSIVITDEYRGYNKMPKEFHHIVIKHKDEEYARGAFHNNTIEGFWSLVKRGIIGTYHYTSSKHLHRYFDEFAFRYNLPKSTAVKRFEASVRSVACRLTYKELTGKSGNIGGGKEAKPQAQSVLDAPAPGRV